MSWRHKRESMGKEVEKRAMAASGPDEKRPPHSAGEVLVIAPDILRAWRRKYLARWKVAQTQTSRQALLGGMRFGASCCYEVILTLEARRPLASRSMSNSTLAPSCNER